MRDEGALMDYASAIDKFLNTNRNIGNETAPLNIIIEANAADKLVPGRLDVNGNGQLTWNGNVLSGPATDFPGTLNAPGFWLGSLISDGSTPFVVPFNGFPSVLRTPFDYKHISGLIGDGATAYLDAIIALHNDRLKPSNLLPADEMRKVISLCSAGVVCVPASTATLQNLYRLLPDLPRQPVFDKSIEARGLSAWASVVLSYDESRKAFLNRDYGRAAELAVSAAAAADRWDTIYKAVEVVATPAILVGLAPESDSVKHLGWPLISFGLVGIVVAIGIGYLVINGKSISSIVPKVA